MMQGRKEGSLEVFTLDEVAAMLRVDVATLRREAEDGRLHILQIGGEFRVLNKDLNDFLELARVSGNGLESTITRTSEAATEPSSRTNLESSSPFSHTWPNRRVEEYVEAFEGTARIGKELRQVRVGFTHRKAAGKLRRRAVVFVDKRPFVEFVAADDFDSSDTMVSLLKRKNGKQVSPGSPLPAEYKKCNVQPYRDYVSGPYASTNMALVCKADDLSVMAEHALIRLRYVESRK